MSVSAREMDALSRLIDTLDPETESWFTATDLYTRLLEQEALQGAAESSARIAAQHAQAAADAAAREQPSDRVAKLAAELQAAALTPGRYTDEQREKLVGRLNAEIRAAEQAALGAGDKPSSVDVGALAPELEAALQVAARGQFDLSQADQLIGRFNAALPQGNPSSYAAADLQSALNGQDQVLRFKAAVELQQRGALPEGQADQLVSEVNAAVREVDQAARERGGPLDPEQLPEGPMRTMAEGMLAQVRADEAERRNQDPRDRLIGDFNAQVRAAGEAAREHALAAVPAAAPSTEHEET